MEEFYFVLEGVGRMRVGGETLTVPKYGGVLVGPREGFEQMNRAYREAFGDHLPARSVVGVADLPKKGALLTMNLTAVTAD